MRLGIIGLPQSGKYTLFRALSSTEGQEGKGKVKQSEENIATVMVPDERFDYLTTLFKPRKFVHSQIEYLLPAKSVDLDYPKKERDDAGFNSVRTCDGLIHVVKNFAVFGTPPPRPEEDFLRLESDLIVSDLMVTEKRTERIKSDSKKGKGINEDELNLLERCANILSSGRPLRDDPELAFSPLLRGYTFLSAKPVLTIINNSDEDEIIPEMPNIPKNMQVIGVRVKLEMEIGEMEPEEAVEFRSAYNIKSSLLDRVIKRSLSVCNLISFFTIAENEARSWSISRGSSAFEAAGLIHSDMQKGFIRAEVIHYNDLVKYGGFTEAKKDGNLRLEGKDYIVEDGDIIKFRFKV